ncbi:MAG: RodZ domain-containing protein [Thermoanaerobaculia bacterium]
MSQPVSEETSKSVEAHTAQSPGLSFGAWLRHQREARSVSMREIADNSKISLRYLEALEQDRFDVLPAPVFARGFLREYARVVGLNPDEVVNLYLVALEERAEGTRRIEHPKPARAESLSSAPSSLGYGLLLGLAVVLFVGIAALLSFLAERRRGVPTESQLVAPATMVAPASGAPAPAALVSLSPAEPGIGAGEPAGTMAEAPASGSPMSPVATATSPAPAAAVAAADGVPPAAAGPFRVVLNFSQDCWMESVVDGIRRTSELKAAGETVQLEAFQSVVLTLGNSRALTVEVDGVPFALPENSTRVVRDLRIERPGQAGPAPAGAPPRRPGLAVPTPGAIPADPPPVRR